MRLIPLLGVGAGIMILSGCTTLNTSPKRAFIERNPGMATNLAELYEIPVDHWVELELSEGLGRLHTQCSFARRQVDRIEDTVLREKARRILSDYVEEADHRLIQVLLGINGIRSKMGPDDHLFYCRQEGDIPNLFGRFFIVQNGMIREEVFTLSCTWGIGNEAMWSKFLDEIKR
ncbi:MAG: hypothetical protein C5B50_20635 [Verrucomicrobia bacterium]|nr:MAG: hypothetical protein C5B50_20635 [Verrucomicrobiota bacterium]